MTGNHKDATITRRLAFSADGGTCVLMSGVTEGPYCLDNALVRKGITEGKSGVPLSVRHTGQLFFPDDAAEAIFAQEPYSRHSGSYTTLDDDMVYDGGGTPPSGKPPTDAPSDGASPAASASS